MKSTSSNFRTSSAIALSRSWANTCFFYRTGEDKGDTFNLWTIIEGLIPGLSLWLQANTSWFSLRNVVSAWHTGWLANVPTLVVCFGLESSRVIFSSSSTGSAIIRCSSMHMVCWWSFISSTTTKTKTLPQFQKNNANTTIFTDHGTVIVDATWYNQFY